MELITSKYLQIEKCTTMSFKCHCLTITNVRQCKNCGEISCKPCRNYNGKYCCNCSPSKLMNSTICVVCYHCGKKGICRSFSPISSNTTSGWFCSIVCAEKLLEIIIKNWRIIISIFCFCAKPKCKN